MIQFELLTGTSSSYKIFIEVNNMAQPTDEEMIRWFIDLGMSDDWIVWIMKEEHARD